MIELQLDLQLPRFRWLQRFGECEDGRVVFPDATGGVGRTFLIGNPADPDNLAEIVGVVKDVRYRNLTQDMMEESNSPDVFFAMAQVPSGR